MNTKDSQIHFKEQIIQYVLDGLEFDEKEIVSIDENTGFIWITFNDGSIKSINIIQVEEYERF